MYRQRCSMVFLFRGGWRTNDALAALAVVSIASEIRYRPAESTIAILYSAPSWVAKAARSIRPLGFQFSTTCSYQNKSNTKHMLNDTSTNLPSPSAAIEPPAPPTPAPELDIRGEITKLEAAAKEGDALGALVTSRALTARLEKQLNLESRSKGGSEEVESFEAATGRASAARKFLNNQELKKSNTTLADPSTYDYAKYFGQPS